MNAIALQSTPTLRKRRMAIADFNFKCDRPSNFATPYRYATSTNTSKVRSAGEERCDRRLVYNSSSRDGSSGSVVEIV